MKKICRVLNIRKHKLVVFVDAYTNSGKIKSFYDELNKLDKIKTLGKPRV